MGSRSTVGTGNFEGGGAAHCKVQGHSAVSCAKTAETMEMPFGFLAPMGPRNRVLDGFSIASWEAVHKNG